MPDLAEAEPQALLDGSARLALKTEPRFNRYIFIERSPERCAQLELLKQEFPDLARDIQIRHGDANTEIEDLCAKDWSSHRAVLFLDPYGMQVDWTTIEAIARTKAIDLWVLFPLGIGVNRLLTKSGDIPESWRRRLNLLLGTEEWYDEFYRSESTPTLFGGEAERVVKASAETIGRYFNNRLKSIFAAVADEPKVLRNSANSPLHLLCFAVGNPLRASEVAPRPSGGVAHAMDVTVASGCRTQHVRRREAPRVLPHPTRSIATHIFRTIRPGLSGRMLPVTRAHSARACRPVAVQ